MNIYHTYFTFTIRYFRIAQNTLCLPPKILHKHCFQFLLGMTTIPRKIENNAKYALFWGGGGWGQTKCIMGNLKILNIAVHLLKV